jgi:hypothetical protein
MAAHAGGLVHETGDFRCQKCHQQLKQMPARGSFFTETK